MRRRVSKETKAPHLIVILSACALTVLLFFLFAQPWRAIQQSQLQSAPESFAAETNVLLNSSFETNGSPIANWQLTNASTARSTLTRDTTATQGTYSAKIVVTSATSTQPWNSSLRQVVTMNNGQLYNYRFWAKASAAREIRAVIMQSYDPYTTYSYRNFNLTTNWQEYSFQYTARKTDQVMIRFDVAKATGTIWFDNAQFAYTYQSTPIATTSATSTSQSTPTATTDPSSEEENVGTEEDYSEYEEYWDTDETSYDTAPDANIPFEQKTITLDTTTPSITLDKQNAVNGRVSDALFTIKNDNVSMWNLKFPTAPRGVTFSPVTHISSPDDEATVQVSMSTQTPNGTFTGQGIVQYYKNNQWYDGPLFNYNISLIGSTAAQSNTTINQRALIITPKPTINVTPRRTASPTIQSIIQPTINLRNPTSGGFIRSSSSANLSWESNLSNLITKIMIYKQINGKNYSSTVIEEAYQTKRGLNNVSFDSTQQLPGEYRIGFEMSAGSQNNNIQSTKTDIPVTIGSRVIVYAAKSDNSPELPNLQLLVKGQPVKTIYGVQGNAQEDKFMQYVYYSTERMLPNQIGFKELVQAETIDLQRIKIKQTVIE